MTLLFGPSRLRPPAVYLVRPTQTTDSYGDPVEDWQQPERRRLVGARVQMRDSVESPGDGRQRVVTEVVLYVPGDPEITEDDRVEVDGAAYRVEGLPAVHRGLTSVYTSATLRRVTG